MRSVLCAALLASVALSAAEKTWTVEGTVTDGAQPVPGATVFGFSAGPTQRAVTDVKGNFTLTGAGTEPVTVAVTAEKDGYGGAESRTVRTQPGSPAPPVDLVIHKAAVISGRVLDPDGNAMEGVEVILWAKVFVDGRPVLGYRGSDHTNDLGEYRIVSSGAGRCVLEAVPKRLQPHKPAPPPVLKNGERPVRYGLVRKVFYPDADTSDGASTIDVRYGQQVEGMDVRFRRAAVYCARAQAAVANAVVALRESAESGGAGVARAAARPDEAFEICGLPAGSYSLIVSGWTDRDDAASTRVAGFSRTEFAVTTGDVSLGTLRIVPGMSLSGTVAIADNPSPASLLTKLSVRLDPPRDRSNLQGESFFARVNASGAFELPNVLADVYRARLFGLAQGCYVRQMLQGRDDVRFGGVRPQAGPISIVLGCDGAAVSGQVTDKDNQPVHDATVVLMPKQAVDSAEIQTQPSDQDGHFTFSTGVAPGDYYLLAFSTGLAEGQERSVEFLRASLDGAQTVTLGAKSTMVVPLTVRAPANAY